MEIAERTTRSTSFHIAYEGVTLIEAIVTERRDRQRQKKERKKEREQVFRGTGAERIIQNSYLLRTDGGRAHVVSRTKSVWFGRRCGKTNVFVLSSRCLPKA